MEKNQKTIIVFLVLCLMLPILFILAFQENGTLTLEKEDSLENYLPYAVAYSLKDNMSEETIKAQSVILRSNFYYRMETKEISIKEIKEEFCYFRPTDSYKWKEKYAAAAKACKETKGEVLTYQNKICYCPYFYNSSGITRDAFSFFKNGEYPYLIAVPSYRDEECNTYVSYHYFNIKDFGGGDEEFVMEIQECDKSGYVLWIKVGNELVGGEYFRKKYGLPSSCFSIEKQENQIRIMCKGNGHGFGFSQYGANSMANDGKKYEDLLEYYFPEVSLEKCV